MNTTPAVLETPTPPTSTPPSVSDADPLGLAAQVSGAVSAVLLAVGFTTDGSARWALAVQSVVALALLLWTRRKAWSPAAVARKLWEERDAIGRYLEAAQQAQDTAAAMVAPQVADAEAKAARLEGPGRPARRRKTPTG
jgi:hypothetical protein